MAADEARRQALLRFGGVDTRQGAHARSVPPGAARRLCSRPDVRRPRAAAGAGLHRDGRSSRSPWASARRRRSSASSMRCCSSRCPIRTPSQLVSLEHTGLGSRSRTAASRKFRRSLYFTYRDGNRTLSEAGPVVHRNGQRHRIGRPGRKSGRLSVSDGTLQTLGVPADALAGGSRRTR